MISKEIDTKMSQCMLKRPGRYLRLKRSFLFEIITLLSKNVTLNQKRVTEKPLQRNILILKLASCHYFVFFLTIFSSPYFATLQA